MTNHILTSDTATSDDIVWVEYQSPQDKKIEDLEKKVRELEEVLYEFILLGK